MPQLISVVDGARYAKKMNGEQIGFFHLGGAAVESPSKLKAKLRFRIVLPQRTYLLQVGTNTARHSSV